MKQKQVRYDEAVARNLSTSLKKEKYNVPVDAKAEDREKLMARVKSAMGIHKDDNKYNAELKARVGL